MKSIRKNDNKELIETIHNTLVVPDTPEFKALTLYQQKAIITRILLIFPLLFWAMLL